MFPLRGVRVLDLGQYISGPCTSVLLAEMGADVVKVEPPGRGDPFRQWESGGLNATFVAFNRGKRSVELDLKSDDDRSKLYELAETADVMVENFRPGVTTRLGIDFASMTAVSPNLVYCSITGFGSAGPYVEFPAYDGVALGYSGMAGLLLDPDDPVLRGPALADAITAHSAAFAITAALYETKGQPAPKLIEISMLGALTHFLHSAVAKKVVEEREEGPYTRPHTSQAYVLVGSDGGALIIHLSSPPKFWEALCTAIGRPELMEDERFVDRGARKDHYWELRALLQEAFAEKERDEWLRVLQSHQVPCAPVNSIGEALQDPQLAALGIIDTVEDPDVGTMPRIRPPVHIDGAPLPPVPRAPLLGEHNEEVLGELARRSDGDR
jgi:crotonobetainyl-CoA:carnitine CoA-transferase CaiB-like acyl-CoA transferase